ncbi:cyclic nucleotide-binding domain-containing protein [Pontibacter vulgaris]|uniref:cyclic nucleotide-binding domain-containing protein n=1 Tax=Pontibacter vulgaris TaxID=2905679 RepID=UPI001FA7CBCB|nr:cyclic nucleotide-binding domain-containing protein [Pontibacter vulgaris]
MLIKQLIESHRLPAIQKVYQPEEELFSAGNKADKLFYLTNGSVRIVSDKPAAAVHQVQPDTLLGLPDLMHEKYGYTARVQHPSQLYVINKQDILKLLPQEPALRMYLLQLLSKVSERKALTFE